jgi:RHS repeat-associated protein
MKTKLLLVGFVLPLVLAVALGQTDPTDDEMLKNGFLGSGTYAGGADYSVNLYNGNLIVGIPLITLPGRAGHDLQLTMSYNSKQLVRRQVYTSANYYWQPQFYQDGPTSGRWLVNSWPTLKTDSSTCYYFTSPDGAVHKMDREGYPSGYYYASDGSGLRYHAGVKRVEFPDGTYFDFSESAYGRVHHVDRNGNRITYQSGNPRTITDTLGRRVLVYYVDDPNHWSPSILLIDRIVVENDPADPHDDLVYQFGYGTKTIGPFLAVSPTCNNPWACFWDFNHQHHHCYYYGVTAGNSWFCNNNSVLTSLTLPDGTSYQFTYNEDVINTCSFYPPVTYSTLQLTSMILPTGASLGVAYAPFPSPCAVGEYDKMYDLRLAHMVGAVTVNPGEGQPLMTTYAYTFDLDTNVTKTTETRPDGSKRIVNWNPAPTPGFAFLRQQENFTDTDGSTVLQTVKTGWVQKEAGKYAYLVESWAGAVPYTKTESNYNDYGQLTYQTKSVNYSSGQWVETSGVRNFYSNYTQYFYYQLRLVRSDDLRFWPGTSTEYVAGSTRQSYDQFALTDRGSVVGQASGYEPTYKTRGNPTTIARFLASENRTVSTKLYYDTLGNVVKTIDPDNRITLIDYSPDLHYGYPTQVTNAKGHPVRTSYNLLKGLPVSATDPNNQTSYFFYDQYNRLTRKEEPDGSWRSITYEDAYAAGEYRTRVTTETSVDIGKSAITRQYFDGLGRLLRTENGEPGGGWVRVDQQFAACNCSGKVARTSMPYRPGDEIRWTETRYDGLGRVKKVIPPDGTELTNYTEYRYIVAKRPFGSYPPEKRFNGPLVGVFDAKGIGRAYFYDSLGNLRQVRENASYSDLSSTTITEYDFLPDTNWRLESYAGLTLNHARSVTSRITQGVQTRTTKVDGLGRVMEETHPENGSTTYAYTDSGRLLQKTDARGIVTTTTYDELYRPLLVDFSDSTPDLSYTYDSGAFGIGRLSTVSNGVATSAYTYSAMGQVLREDKTINGLPFFMTWQYNLAGQVTATRLANGTTITNAFDDVGRLAAVTSDWVDANHPGTLASGFLYHASGAVTRMDLGNGTRMTRGFNDGLQLKTLEHGPIGAPGALLNFEYDYQEGVSNNGRIMGITNWNDRTRDLVFTYDSFYRLDSAQTTGSHWGLAWTYDRYGNRLSQTATKGTGPANTLSVSTATNRVNGWSYDAAGNTTNDGRHLYTWNALNQQTTVDNGAAVYHYDAAGNRVMKVTPTKTTYYVFGVGEYSGGVWEKLYVSINGQKAVEYSNGTTYFFHSDHLGTPRVQTSVTGQVVETWDNYPYGEQWTTTGGVGNTHRYTGKERDTESANDYFGARYYWNGAARWLSVDPEKVPTDPQQLNGYNYVRNDPVNFVDRDGRNLGMINEGGGECSPGDPFCGVAGYGYWYAGAEGTGKWWSYFGGNPGTTSPTPQPPGGGETPEQKFEKCREAYKTPARPMGRGRKQYHSAEWNLTYENYQLGLVLAGQAGIDGIDFLAIWGAESSFSTNPNYAGGGPMQVTKIAFNALKGYGYVDDADYDSWTKAGYPLSERLLAGANYFAVVLMYQMTGIPRDQAYAVYNGGPGGYQSKGAQKHLARFNEIWAAVDAINKCMEGN